MGIKLKNSKTFRIVNIIILITMIIVLPIQVSITISSNKAEDSIYDRPDIIDYLLAFENKISVFGEQYVDLNGTFSEENIKSSIQTIKLEQEDRFNSSKNYIEDKSYSDLDEKASKEKRDILVEESRKRIIMSDEEIKEVAIKRLKEDLNKSRSNLIDNNVNIEFYYENTAYGSIITNVPGSNLEEFTINKNKNDNDILKIRTVSMGEDAGEYTRCYRIPKVLVPGDFLYDVQLEENKIKYNFNRNIILTIAMGVILLLELIVAYKNRKKGNSLFLDKYYRWVPIEIKLISPILVIANISIIKWEISSGENIYTFIFIVAQVVLLSISYLLINKIIEIDTLKIDYENMKKRSILYNIKALIVKFTDLLKGSFLVKSTAVRLGIAIVMTVLAYIGAMFLHRYSQYEYYWYGKYVVAYEILYQIIIIIYVFNFSKRLNLLKLNTDKIVEGNYDVEIEVKGPRIVKEITANIKNIEAGFSKAVDAGIKSEKLKGELITNVSHDLKTPLTSIISYVDLLKNENLKEVDRIKYINVLDRKAQRLKVLIEDLFEASKAASGSIELQKENIDVTSLLRQTLGEFQEKISASSLEFINKWPEEKAELYLDGKKTWRVFENLISNILKYSMKNSRVYIDVIKNIDNVQIVMKNISAYQLDFTEEEVIERFKRGDKSRNTEGSGLGLSIAKSLTDLQGGTLKIEIDGDLFKVILTFPSK
ncbi:sensor histidine kinase [Clostridium gasigenes]|uniref:sensor histidine kinase n=1 Tax=Clostridium gasigenes TaxID=94869 RepID=UPI001C0E32DB|nr:sensor histidine kinase [Clostridium gasigenes]MBU3088371.1 sensor histidine kinase [Clostridium gasigenes]